MPTAIGHGIAIPHPRTPVITVADNTSVSICYLEAPFDFGALDGQEVHNHFYSSDGQSPQTSGCAF
jgi:PTS system nitrogen regulatory IIA component